MWKWLQNILVVVPPEGPPKLAIEALPVTVNPNTSEAAKRHAGRVQRILLALSDGQHEDQRGALERELRQRQGFLTGHEAGGDL